MTTKQTKKKKPYKNLRSWIPKTTSRIPPKQTMKPHLRNLCAYQVPVNQLKSLTHSDNHQDIFFVKKNKTKQQKFICIRLDTA